MLINYGFFVNMFKKFSMISFLICSTAYCDETPDYLDCSAAYRSEISDYLGNPATPRDIIAANLPIDRVIQTPANPIQEEGEPFNVPSILTILKEACSINIRAPSNYLEYVNNFPNQLSKFKAITRIYLTYGSLNPAKKKEATLILKNILDYHSPKDFPGSEKDSLYLKLLRYLFYFLTVNLEGNKIKHGWRQKDVTQIFKFMNSLREELTKSEFKAQIYRVVSQDEDLFNIFLRILYKQTYT